MHLSLDSAHNSRTPSEYPANLILMSSVRLENESAQFQVGILICFTSLSSYSNVRSNREKKAFTIIAELF